MSQGKKIPAKPLWTKKIACTIGQQEKKFLRWPILPTPPPPLKDQMVHPLVILV